MFEQPASVATGAPPDAPNPPSEADRRSPEALRALRVHSRISVKAGVIVQPGNASQRHIWSADAVTGDISQGGCRILLKQPLGVGDIYRLEFDRKLLNVPPTYARCMRCHVLRENAFEAGLAFFSPIVVPAELQARSGR